MVWVFWLGVFSCSFSQMVAGAGIIRRLALSLVWYLSWENSSPGSLILLSPSASLHPHPTRITTSCAPCSLVASGIAAFLIRWLRTQKPVPLKRLPGLSQPNLGTPVPSRRPPSVPWGSHRGHLVHGEEYQTMCKLVLKSPQSYREAWILCWRAVFPRVNSLLTIFAILS